MERTTRSSRLRIYKHTHCHTSTYACVGVNSTTTRQWRPWMARVCWWCQKAGVRHTHTRAHKQPCTYTQGRSVARGSRVGANRSHNTQYITCAVVITANTSHNKYTLHLPRPSCATPRRLHQTPPASVSVWVDLVGLVGLVRWAGLVVPVATANGIRFTAVPHNTVISVSTLQQLQYFTLPAPSSAASG